MRILFIGDIVGKVGRNMVSELLNRVTEEYRIDFSIANCENSAGGFGVTRKIAESLFDQGIDILTSGNHIWDNKEILEIIDVDNRILRPANYYGVPGEGSVVVGSASGKKVGVINISGRIFVDYLDCPFRSVEKELEKMKGKTKVIIVDFHAEATSEKIAMGWYLNGKVSAVLGTHTHVQTADEKILNEGTAYITDVGMTGPIDSVIGIKKEIALKKFLTHLPQKFDMAKGRGQLNAVVIEINDDSGRARSIERIQLSHDSKDTE